MQPTPLVRITGTVLTTRLVTIEPRPATETTKAYEGTSYSEVTLATPHAVIDREAVPGLLAYVTVRFNNDDKQMQHMVGGSEHDLLCSSFVDTFKVRGRFVNTVGYRFQTVAVTRDLASV